jgi:hypothetical protein
MVVLVPWGRGCILHRADVGRHPYLRAGNAGMKSIRLRQGNSGSRPQLSSGRLAASAESG